MSAPKPYSNRELTQHLRALAAEAITIDNNGNVVTRGEKLASDLWERAIGYESKDPKDPDKIVKHAPEAWAIQLIYERMEGKSPTALPDEAGGMKVTDRVDELHKDRLNQMAMAASGAKMPKGPPSFKRKS